MRPSLVTPALNPCLFPSSLTVSSTRLGFPLILFTTSCSQPDDFVKTSTDLFEAPSNRFESASPAPVSVAARRNSLRLESASMLSLLVMSFRVLATRKTCKHAVRCPSQLFHSHFRRVIRSAHPSLQVFTLPAALMIFGLASTDAALAAIFTSTIGPMGKGFIMSK